MSIIEHFQLQLLLAAVLRVFTETPTNQTVGPQCRYGTWYAPPPGETWRGGGALCLILLATLCFMADCTGKLLSANLAWYFVF